LIKIGIDPSGTGTTAIVVYIKNKLIEKYEFTNKLWIKQVDFIRDILCKHCNSICIVNIENCLFISANGSKDRDNLLRLLGVIEDLGERLRLFVKSVFNWVSPKYTKSVVKNIENLSKYNNGCIQEFIKDINLTYEYGKGWKYNNEKISNHLRDAIIIANYENKNNEN